MIKLLLIWVAVMNTLTLAMLIDQWRAKRARHLNQVSS